jgi:hypothetical protein
MGVVWQVLALHDQSQCFALKTIKGVSRIADFDRECSLWLSVAHHPNIARALAFGAWQGLPSVLIDWYDRTLADVQLSQLPVDRIATLLHEACQGLEFAQREAGIIHRDIKPQNILIDSGGHARVSDFGIARCRPDPSRRAHGSAESFPGRGVETIAAGTPYFMAPELWRGGQPSIKTDIFSLGVTFFHLLTGRHPHVGATQPDPGAHARQLRDTMRGPSDEVRALAECIVRCVSMNSSERPSTYAELAERAAVAGADCRAHARVARTSFQVAAEAAVVSASGNDSDAEFHLRSRLAAAPGDPVLLGALAAHYAAFGDVARADEILLQSYRRLCESHGVYGGITYLDPAMAWAGRLIDRHDWAQACTVIRNASSWAATPAMQSFNGISTMEIHEYPEFGWLLFRDGRFDDAYRTLCRAAVRATPGKLQLAWWIAAAGLSNQPSLALDDIAPYAAAHDCSHELAGNDFAYSLALSWLQLNVNPIAAKRIWKTSRPKALYVLSEIEERHCLEAGSLLAPRNPRSRAVLLGEIYCATTGRNIDEISSAPPRP